MEDVFYIPEKTFCAVEQIIKKSRFIAFLKKVQTKDEALEFISEMRQKHKDARHNCWAYLIGSPASPSAIGYSDDGEPKGTAGPPILNILQQNKLSMAVIVVTRYFGGVKLGSSGLIRAYSGTAKLAAEKAGSVKHIEKIRLKVKTTYQYINKILNILSQDEIPVVNSGYLENVSLEIEVNKKDRERITGIIKESTKGTCEIRESES
ncbi:MAG: YigZ family protein [Victivallales bacterium]|nr:YigZ family protein [Victivallales bacterium]MCF7888708.1 YigZ family protein [Victivallales bacterium]